MKHLAGNMLSRWTNFLTTDREKPTRHRDNEFVDDFVDRNHLTDYWSRAWRCVYSKFHGLKPEDLAQVPQTDIVGTTC